MRNAFASGRQLEAGMVEGGVDREELLVKRDCRSITGDVYSCLPLLGTVCVGTNVFIPAHIT